MPIEDKFKLQSSGAVVVGHVKRGQLRRGDRIAIVGLYHEPTYTVAASLEVFHEPVTSAQAGQAVAVRLDEIEVDWVERGMVLAQPESIGAYSGFRASFQAYPPEAMGFPHGDRFPVSSVEFSISYPYQFSGEPHLYIYGRAFQCDIADRHDDIIRWSDIRPDDRFSLLVTVEKPLALEVGWNFRLGVAIDEKSDVLRPIGVGQITETASTMRESHVRWIR